MTRLLRAYQERRAVRHEFDPAFYRSTYADLRGADPLNHYMKSGWKEGRDPRPDFSTRYYLAAYPDVRDAGVNPFYHYVISGKSEGRSTRPTGYSPTQTLTGAAQPSLNDLRLRSKAVEDVARAIAQHRDWTEYVDYACLALEAASRFIASASDREKLMSAVAAWRDLQFFESLESDALARYLAERPKQDHTH
jgi:hypothetical protein